MMKFVRVFCKDKICKDTKMLHRYRYHHTDIGADTDADKTSIIYSNFFLNNPTCYEMASSSNKLLYLQRFNALSGQCSFSSSSLKM